MMLRIIILLLHLVVVAQSVHSQAVGIGTASPNSKSVLDLSSTSKVFLPPRMTEAQMNAIPSPPYGSMIYNTDNHQFMGYVKSHSYRTILNQTVTVNKWLPMNTGPKTLAWGVVDSFGNKITSSENFSVNWDGYGNGSSSTTNNWYEFILTGDDFNKDSMILLVTAVGNGRWDQTIAIGELVSGSLRKATIKFTDVSRIAAGWSLEATRRRSNFYFVLYDLR